MLFVPVHQDTEARCEDAERLFDVIAVFGDHVAGHNKELRFLRSMME